MRPVGEIIREERERKNWSLAKLGRATDLDSGYLSKLETGIVKDPGFLQIRRIADALGISCTVLFEEPRPAQPTSTTVPSTAAERPTTLQVGMQAFVREWRSAPANERRKWLMLLLADELDQDIPQGIRDHS